ncbi:hypothetical protein [Methanolobus sp. WCC4]|uniref:hypothetical protein n=1 Tax=Methanolobus sp. WCC4 TaxID=3125784 RepID=UPI0030FC4886
MAPNDQDQTLMEFLNILDRESSVLSYTEGSEVPDLLRSLSREIEKRDAVPVIKIIWNENELPDEDGTGNVTSFHLFKNFTTTMIRIGKLLSGEKHLVVLSDLSSLEQLENNRPYIHFLSVLLRKCEKYESTVLTTMNDEYTCMSVRTDLIPFFNNLFMLEKGKRIKEAKDGAIDLRYTIDEDRLVLEPYMQSDMNKIKEIFSLTPEEKKELDRIVGQSLEEYRTSM